MPKFFLLHYGLYDGPHPVIPQQKTRVEFDADDATQAEAKVREFSAEHVEERVEGPYEVVTTVY